MRNVIIAMFIVIGVISISAFPSKVYAEKITVVANGEYIMGDGETKTVAKERADLDAMRYATEKAGVYVESYTRIKNSMVDKDVIETISSNILKVEKKEYKLEIIGESIKIVSQITAVIDTKEIEENTNETIRNKKLVEQNITLKKNYEDCLQELNELKKQLNKSNSSIEKKEVEEKIKNNENKFQAIHYLSEGTRLFNSHDYRGAIEKYNRAIELDKELSAAYANRGNAYTMVGDNQKALNDFNKAITINSNVSWYYRDRGAVYTNVNDVEKGLNDLNKAIELNDKDALAYCNRSTLYYSTEEFYNGMQDAIKAVELNPYIPAGYINKGMLFERMGNIKKALENYNKAIEIGELPSSYYIRGMLFDGIGEYEKAMDDFNNALRIDKNFYMAISNKAILYLRKHQYSEALKLANEGIEINQYDGTLYAIKAAALYHMDNKDLAKKYLIKALDLEPGNKDYFEKLFML